ncbi:MAG: hypothetical protein VKK42_22855 [Lyngbya sp.]|nr:hypothetical protein [Lyngbya sp.]
MQENKKVYISGALTGVENIDEIKEFYSRIGSLSETLGLLAYIPHLNTDPILHPDVSVQQVFDTDKYKVSTSDFVIAYVGIPSIGVGMELAYADMNSIPIILIYEQEKQISRFPRGIPSVIAEVLFSNYEDALIQIKNVLDTII